MSETVNFALSGTIFTREEHTSRLRQLKKIAQAKIISYHTSKLLLVSLACFALIGVGTFSAFANNYHQSQNIRKTVKATIINHHQAGPSSSLARVTNNNSVAINQNNGGRPTFSLGNRNHPNHNNNGTKVVKKTVVRKVVKKNYIDNSYVDNSYVDNSYVDNSYVDNSSTDSSTSYTPYHKNYNSCSYTHCSSEYDSSDDSSYPDSPCDSCYHEQSGRITIINTNTPTYTNDNYNYNYNKNENYNSNQTDSYDSYQY